MHKTRIRCFTKPDDETRQTGRGRDAAHGEIEAEHATALIVFGGDRPVLQTATLTLDRVGRLEYEVERDGKGEAQANLLVYHDGTASELAVQARKGPPATTTGGPGYWIVQFAVPGGGVARKAPDETLETFLYTVSVQTATVPYTLTVEIKRKGTDV